MLTQAHWRVIVRVHPIVTVLRAVTIGVRVHAIVAVVATRANARCPRHRALNVRAFRHSIRITISTSLVRLWATCSSMNRGRSPQARRTTCLQLHRRAGIRTRWTFMRDRVTWRPLLRAHGWGIFRPAARRWFSFTTTTCLPINTVFFPRRFGAT